MIFAIAGTFTIKLSLYITGHRIAPRDVLYSVIATGIEWQKQIC